jgi:toxin secretion/phage lysis holin
MDTFTKTSVSLLSGSLVYVFGTWNELFGIYLVLWFLDVVTGLVASGNEGKLSSTSGVHGIAKKVLIFAIISVAHFADIILNTGDIVRNSTLFWFVINEMVSIAENCGRAGVPLPPKLQQALELLSDRKKDKDKAQ